MSYFNPDKGRRASAPLAPFVAAVLGFGCSGGGEPASSDGNGQGAASGSAAQGAGAADGDAGSGGDDGAGASEGGSSGGQVSSGGSAGSPSDELDPSGLSFDELLAEAPLARALQGSLTTWRELTFVVPEGWTGTEYEDAVQLTSAGDPEEQCAIAILEPRAAAADDEGRFAQLLEIIQALFPGYPLANELPVRRRGISGMGFEFVGLAPYVGPSALSEPYLAIFGDVAVPVIPYGPSMAPCWASNAGIADRAEVFHSLTLAGFEPAGADLITSRLSGVWFINADQYGDLLVLSESGIYGQQFGANVSIPVSSNVVEESFVSWEGEEGRYASAYNLAFFFPSDGSAPYSLLTSTYESQVEGAEARRYLCQLKTTIVDGEDLPYEACFLRVAD